MSRLDQIVKGAPAPEANVPSSLSKTPSPHFPQPVQRDKSEPAATATPDPLSILPSSPPQIYLNLLILEGSLRSQYLALRDRRRQNTFFILILALWIAYFSYALFLRPREDGSGVGGSVYWVVEMAEKVALMGGVVTGILIWGTGQWERGVRWPRRWLGVTNRGLRTINAKVVVIRGPWWKELLSFLAFLFPYSSFFPPNTSFHYVERPATREKGRRPAAGGNPYYGEDAHGGVVEEDLAPGGDYVQLLLLPKAFSAAFRENWDEYRTEYWERENERRSKLRKKLNQRERQIAKQEGGWLWWAGWRGWKRRNLPAGRDLEKSHHGHNHHRRPNSRHGADKLSRPRRGTGSGGTPPRFGESHSRTSSRSSTPIPFSDLDDKTSASDRERTRRGSNVGGERRKKRPSVSRGSRAPSPLSPIDINSTSPDDGYLTPARLS